MRICIYGAASNRIDKVYFDKCEELGEQLAKRGHSLVYGAGAGGLMGAAARGFKKGGGYVHGVIPKFFEENGYEAVFYSADKLTRTDTMEDRKAIMEDEAEAFIIVPGGIGTLDEFFQILTLKQLGRFDKAITVFNINGHYDKTVELIDELIKRGFVNKECDKLYSVFENIEDVICDVENYSGKGIDWDYLKKTD